MTSISSTTFRLDDATEFPPLKVERMADGLLNLIDPTEDGSGNLWMVRVHPVHIRHLAEQLGLIVTPGPEKGGSALSAAPPSLAEVQRENDRLKRNLLRLQGHALALQEDFRENADWQHADLTHEMNNINALVDLFDMAVDDFADDYTAHEPSGAPAVPTSTTSPKTGPFETDPKTGALGLAEDVTPRHATSRARTGQAKGKPAAHALPQLDLEG